MPIELECKVRVDSHDSVRTRLTALRATCQTRVLETNVFFERPDGSLQEAGCGLRIRSTVGVDGRKGEATLTYKGPRQPGRFKRREEIETAVGDAEATAAILRALGLHERLVFQKRRESWRLGACRVELDELPRLGLFVEIEGPDDGTILAALNDLGLGQAKSIVDSYASMAAALAPVDASQLAELRFG